MCVQSQTVSNSRVFCILPSVSVSRRDRGYRLYMLLVTLAGLIVLVLSASREHFPRLYSNNDRLLVANANNIGHYLITNKGKNLVQFYNAFCAHCRRYAAEFKELAKKLYKWRSVLNVIVVDCAAEINVSICRDFAVKNVPSMRFVRKYPTNYTVIDTLDPDEITEWVADRLSKEALLWPVFSGSKLVDFNKYTFLVYQPPNSTIGRDTVLEMLEWSWNAVTRYVTDSKVAAKFGLDTNIHKLIVIDTYGKVYPLKPSKESSKAYAKAASNYIRKLGFTPDPTRPTVATTAPSVNDEQESIIQTVLKGKSKVYRADLEQAIDTILHIEVPKANRLEGDNKKAIQNILTLIEAFNPINKEGKIVVRKLNKFLRSKKSLSGEEYQKELRRLESKQGPIFSAKRYIGCIPSRPFKRGYSCTLWVLFHYLTVMSAKESDATPPRTVLLDMRAYIINFFGCTHCVEHFKKMAIRRRIEDAKTRFQQILWLWEAHNEVNNRLSGDETEDPTFLKIQYPNKKSCPKCQNTKKKSYPPCRNSKFKGRRNATIQWDKNRVLEFLRNVYDRKALSFYGLPSNEGYE